jgi:hypothetical protein
MKSTYTKSLDIIRHLLIIGLSIYFIYLIWGWSWIWALILAIPIYVIVMNIVGFATLPFYAKTPENRKLKKEFDDFQDEYLS